MQKFVEVSHLKKIGTSGAENAKSNHSGIDINVEIDAITNPKKQPRINSKLQPKRLKQLQIEKLLVL